MEKETPKELRGGGRKGGYPADWGILSMGEMRECREIDQPTAVRVTAVRDIAYSLAFSTITYSDCCALPRAIIIVKDWLAERRKSRN